MAGLFKANKIDVQGWMPLDTLFRNNSQYRYLVRIAPTSSKHRPLSPLPAFFPVLSWCAPRFQSGTPYMQCSGFGHPSLPTCLAVLSSVPPIPLLCSIGDCGGPKEPRLTPHFQRWLQPVLIFNSLPCSSSGGLGANSRFNTLLKCFFHL